MTATVDYTRVSELLGAEKFDLVYVAIGCAQGHYEYGKHSPQQLPPCVAELGGRQLCVLIDPCLESVPYVYRDLGIGDKAGDVAMIGNTTIVCMRHEFHWPSRFTDPALVRVHTEFMDRLCAAACADGGPRLIVQDYCGADIRLYYPVGRYPSVLLKKVLFDFTYRDSGCFVDFSKVKLLRDKAGDFLQPAYTKLSVLADAGVDMDGLKFELSRRCNTILYAVLPLYQIYCGLKEPREWCTPERVLTESGYLFGVYNIQAVANPASLKRLLSEFFYDLARAAESYFSDQEVDSMIDAGGDSYRNAVEMLKAVI